MTNGAAGEPAHEPQHATDADPQNDQDPRWRLSGTKIIVTVILLAAIVIPLLVGSYATVEPRLFGFPFFYWYQLAWVFLAAGCCGISFLLLRAERRRYERDHQAGSGQEVQR